MTDANTPSDEETPHSFDELANLWTSQPTEKEDGLMAVPNHTLVSQMASAYKRDRRVMIWLNIQETVPSLLLSALLLSWAAEAEIPLAVYLAAAIPIAVAGYMIVMSVRVDRRSTEWGDSTRASIERRLAQVKFGSRVFRNILWWYLLPLAATATLALYGAEGRLGFDSYFLIFYAAAAAVVGIIYVMNRLVGKVKYDGEVERLQRLLADFDSDQ